MKKSAQASLTPDFSQLILSIASAALLKMGLDPQSKESEDRDMARYNIDLLSILKEKTKNNLTEKEAQLLDACIQDLQLKFVQTEHKGEAHSTEEAAQKKPAEAKATEKPSPNKTVAEKKSNGKSTQNKTEK